MDEGMVWFAHAQGLAPVRVNGSSGEEFREGRNGQDKSRTEGPRQHLDDGAPEGKDEERPGQRADTSPSGAEGIEHRRRRGRTLQMNAKGNSQHREQTPDSAERQRKLPRSRPLLLVLTDDCPVRAASHGGDQGCSENSGHDGKQPDPQLPWRLPG